ncbi:hypothetical protein [Phytohalomonas tamaricis]|uniref:hypothetical protein n=1 Tax=Phytohalomonas tamaricis TaxID=2081032 RepID=UPI000D0BB7D6|nr:hypothetical protein [Phytohalomonas tamaricis]
MFTLEHNFLKVRFPHVHPSANATISFQRTLRIPDDNREYPLPAGMDRFDLRHIEDYTDRIPDSWARRGGVLLPMYQAEAMWINFNSEYPMAIKIAAGKINAVTGTFWQNELSDTQQDYVVIPSQPWIDGFSTAEEQVRQFVASRLGDGQSAEEQVTGESEFGGLQLIVYPLKAELYEIEQAQRAKQTRLRKRDDFDYLDIPAFARRSSPEPMGLGLGGKIHQSLYKDKRGIEAWDDSHYARCFIHLINSQDWKTVTGEPLPRKPIKPEQYQQAGLPWFDYYDEGKLALPGGTILSRLKSFAEFRKKTDKPDKSIQINHITQLGNQTRVSDGEF